MNDIAFAYLNFTKDTITLFDFYKQKYKYAYKIVGKNIVFSNHYIPYNLKNDSVLNFGCYSYDRDDSRGLSIYNKLDLNVPIIEVPDSISYINDNYFPMAYSKLRNSEKKSSCLLLNSLFEMNEIPDYIDSWRFRDEPHVFTVILTVDRNTTMDTVDLIFNQLNKAYAFKVILVSKMPDNFEFDKIYGVKIKLTNIVEKSIFYKWNEKIPPPYYPEGGFKKKIEKTGCRVININSQNKIFINSEEFQLFSMQEFIFEEIVKDKGIIWLIVYDSKSNYERYLQVKDAYCKAIKSVRVKQSKEMFNMDYDELSDSLRRVIMQKIPHVSVDLLKENYEQILDGTINIKSTKF